MIGWWLAEGEQETLLVGDEAGELALTILRHEERIALVRSTRSTRKDQVWNSHHVPGVETAPTNTHTHRETGKTTKYKDVYSICKMPFSLMSALSTFTMYHIMY